VAISRLNRVKVNQFTIILSGLVLLTASCLVFLFIIKNVYGNFNISEILPTSENLNHSLSGKNYTVAILYSKYTENLLPQGNTWLNDNINTWKTFLRSSKVNYEVINDQAIETGKHFKYKILILPGSKSLSDKEVSQIKKYIEKGGSVFATSGTCSYSDNGKWRGWDFFSEVFGLRFTKEITPEEFAKVHTLRGGLPLTAGIPAGYQLKIATWDRPMSCEVLEPRTTQASFWYNFKNEGGLVREEIKKTAGIAYGKYGNGRFVWMGFELNSVIGQQEDYIYFDRLFQNSLSWLTYSPTAIIHDWPGTYEAAAVITPALINNVNNIYNLLPILKSEGVPATFFVDPSLSEEYRSVLDNLKYYGEVGGIVDLGYMASVNDTINKLLDYNTQFIHVKQAKYNFSKVSRLANNGIIPLYGLYNENSLRAVINSGYDYIFTDSLTDRSVPKTVIRGENKIVSFTKTARDDYEIIRNYGLTNNDFQLYTYEEDVDRLLFERGLYILKLHTDYQCQSQYVDVIRNLIQYLKSKKVWITSASAIKNWWLSKSNLEISTDARGTRRIAVEISNPGNEYVHDVIIQINLNKDVKNLQISSDIFGTKIPAYTFDRKNQILTFTLKRVAPGDSYSYFIDFDNISIL
jgi:peptidoglycan/xylan/chitin deacetylase (PgdA/CDA1 family)